VDLFNNILDMAKEKIRQLRWRLDGNIQKETQRDKRMENLGEQVREK
jgi:hypothetical protein